MVVDFGAWKKHSPVLCDPFISIYSCKYSMNTVAKEISFHFFFHHDFCSNGRKTNHW